MKHEKLHTVIPIFKPADPESAKQFRLKTEGNCETGRLKTLLGENQPEFDYIKLCGKGSSITFFLENISADNELILEIQEIHNRYDLPFAYHIAVNGKTVYYRTYAPCCDGANHYFVKLPTGQSNYAVTFTAEDDRPFRIGKIFAYADAFELVSSEQIDSPMLLGLFSPGLSYNEAEDIKRLNDARDKYAPYPVICGWDIFYIRLSKEALHKQLDYLLHLSEVTGVHIMFDFNSWWSGTPAGMDGKGGCWRDLCYNQVVYDPVDATGFGKYQLTTPNYWKNLPWLTMNNEHYNKARQERLKDAAHYLSKRIAEYTAAGKKLPQVAVFTENEPDYWHYGAWNDSASSIVGVEPCALKAAKKDGVDLNPENGLDDKKCAWLWKNLTDYIVGVGNAIRDGGGKKIGIIKNGRIIPNYPLIEHCYTHATTAKSNQPYQDESHALWETHIINSLRFGYQGGVGDSDPRPLEYATCYGRLAGVNKEQLRESAYSILPYSYLFGADFQTVFNYRHCEESLKNAPKTRDYADKPVPVISYDNQLLKHSFDNEECFNNDGVLIAAENMILSTARGSRAARADESGGKTEGSLLFHIHREGGFPEGLITEFDATVNVNTVLSAELGYAPDELKIKKEIKGKNQYVGAYCIDWSDIIDRSAADIYLKLTLPAGLFKTEYNAPERNSICKFIVRIPRTEKSGHSDGSSFTFSELRRLHRLSERREDAKRLMKSTRRCEKTEELFARGHYQTVYNSLINSTDESETQEFLLYNEGPIGSSPFYIKTDRPVLISAAGGSDGIFIKTEALENATANIEITNKTGNVSCIEADGGYKISVGENKLCRISVSPVSEVLPQKIYGRVLSINNGVARIQTQDMSVTFYADSVELKIADNCKFFLSDDSAKCETEVKPEEIKPNASVLMKTNGNVITEMYAAIGEITGTVTYISEACIKGEIKQPEISVTDGSRTVNAVIGAECSFGFTGATGASLHISHIGNLGLLLGQKVTLCYLPKFPGSEHNRALSIND